MSYFNANTRIEINMHLIGRKNGSAFSELSRTIKFNKGVSKIEIQFGEFVYLDVACSV